MYPWLTGTAERGSEGMEGGWALAALLWLLPWKERRAHVDTTAVSLRGATPGAAMPLSFLCLETLLCALAQHPPILTHVECRRAMGKLGPEGWDGGVGGWGGAAEELLGAGGSREAAACP